MERVRTMKLFLVRTNDKKEYRVCANTFADAEGAILSPLSPVATSEIISIEILYNNILLAQPLKTATAVDNIDCLYCDDSGKFFLQTPVTTCNGIPLERLKNDSDDATEVVMPDNSILNA